MLQMDRVRSKKCSKNKPMLDRRGPGPGPGPVLTLATWLMAVCLHNPLSDKYTLAVTVLLVKQLYVSQMGWHVAG